MRISDWSSDVCSSDLLAQVAAFVVLSFISIQVYRKWFRSREPQSDRPALNRRSAVLVGRVVPLESAIVQGRGRVQIADAYWDVSGPVLTAGAQVRITGADGKIGREHVCTPVTNAHLVCSIMLEKNKPQHKSDKE